MKIYLSALLVSISLLGFSQTNILKNSGIGQLNGLKGHPDGGMFAYRGNKIYKFDSTWNNEWAEKLPIPDGQLLRTTVDSSGNIVAVSHDNSNIPTKVFKLSASGQMLLAKDFNILSGRAQIELIDGGYLLSFEEREASTPISGIVVCRTDWAFNPIWTRILKTPGNLTLYNRVTKVNENNEISILCTAKLGGSDMTASIMTKLNGNGELIWSKKWGTDCTLHEDFDLLPNGGYVAVTGREWEEYERPLRVSVADSTGTILATKVKDYLSGADSGGSTAQVIAKSDGRYVVNIRYVGSHGTYNKSTWIFFDNHEPVKEQDFSSSHFPIVPFAYDKTTSTTLWSRTDSDEILFSGYIDSEGDFSSATYNCFGQFNWYTDSCDLGSVNTPVFDYLIDPTTDFPMSIDTLVLNPIPTIDTLYNVPFSDSLHCQSWSVDPGSMGSGNHLYGDTTWANICSNTMFVGQDELDPLFELNVYPNPSNGQINISTEQSLIEKVLVYDKVGQLVITLSKLQSNKVDLDLQHLSNGTYFVKVLSEGSSRTVPLILMNR